MDIDKNILRPSKEFEAFLQAVVLARAESTSPDPVDVLAQRLWHAAEYDWYRQTGKQMTLLDGGGLPRDDAKAYAVIIQMCKVVDISGAIANVRYDEYYKMFPTLINKDTTSSTEPSPISKLQVDEAWVAADVMRNRNSDT